MVSNSPSLARSCIVNRESRPLASYARGGDGLWCRAVPAGASALERARERARGLRRVCSQRGATSRVKRGRASVGQPIASSVPLLEWGRVV